MAKHSPVAKRILHAVAGASVVAAATTFFTAPAAAHFVLQTPASWMSQDSLGSPQKAGPCGNEGGGTATNMVTAFAEGQTITVTINETVFHPGHYRIALAVNDRSELPADPPVTAGDMPCGTTTVQNPPKFPILADGVLDHTKAFTAPQTVKVTLPPGVTCTKCTLQIIEFMSEHGLNNPGGCFYHHCADISVSGDGGASTTASSSSGSATTSSSSSSGNGASTTTSAGPTSTSSSGSETTTTTSGGPAGTGATASSTTSAATGASAASGAGAGGGGGSTGGSSMSSGCSMSSSASTVAPLGLLVALASLLGRRRRR